MASPSKKTSIPANVKQPSDHKPAVDDVEVPEAFSFDYKGKTYTFKNTKETLKPSWYRRNRRNSPMDQMHAMVEALAADEETLDVYDELLDSDDEALMADTFAKPFNEYVEALFGATPGESKAS